MLNLIQIYILFSIIFYAGYTRKSQYRPKGLWSDQNHNFLIVVLYEFTIVLYVTVKCRKFVVLWASYQIRKIAACACAGNAGSVFPRRRLQRKPLVSDPGMHHGTCVTHVPWCMSGSLTRGGEENVPGIPGACTPAILRIWQEAHARTFYPYLARSSSLPWSTEARERSPTLAKSPVLSSWRYEWK